MTQDNEKFARFMVGLLPNTTRIMSRGIQYKLNLNGTAYTGRYNSGSYWKYLNDLKYDTSWDWLMPVVEKIYNTDDYYKYKQDESRQFHDAGVELSTNIKSVYQQALDFIEWYEKQNGL